MNDKTKIPESEELPVISSYLERLGIEVLQELSNGKEDEEDE